MTWVFLRATAVIGATSMGVLYADLEGAARPNALPLGSPWLGLVLAVVVAGVILGDEPLVGLAPIDQERLGTLLRSVAEAGVAVVTSGHDTRALLEVSDSVIWSVAGTTHHLGSPADAVQHHQFVREYLGPGFA